MNRMPARDRTENKGRIDTPLPRSPAILQVVPDLVTGGAEKSTIEIADALAAAGARALVASRGGPLVKQLEAAGGELVELDVATRNPLRALANVFALARLIRRENVALVHVRSRAPAWSALFAARLTGIPFVTTYHGVYSNSGLLKGFYNGVMARGDVVIANSDFTARLVVDRHAPRGDRVVVIHRGIDLDEFDPAKIAPERGRALREAWGLAGNDHRILLLPARLTAWKGHETAVRAARELKAMNVGDFVLVLAGSDQGRSAYRARLGSLIAELDLRGMVRIVGHCADMAAAFSLADIALVPSVRPEAFGRTAAEAEAMGVPVVVSTLGALCETVLAPPDVTEDARTGWRVPPGDAAALARAMAEALSLSPAARAAMGRRARAHVAAKFALERMTESTLAVYDRLLGTRLSGAGGKEAARAGGAHIPAVTKSPSAVDR